MYVHVCTNCATPPPHTMALSSMQTEWKKKPWPPFLPHTPDLKRTCIYISMWFTDIDIAQNYSVAPMSYNLYPHYLLFPIHLSIYPYLSHTCTQYALVFESNNLDHLSLSLSLSRSVSLVSSFLFPLRPPPHFPQFLCATQHNRRTERTHVRTTADFSTRRHDTHTVVPPRSAPCGKDCIASVRTVYMYFYFIFYYYKFQTSHVYNNKKNPCAHLLFLFCFVHVCFLDLVVFFYTRLYTHTPHTHTDYCTRVVTRPRMQGARGPCTSWRLYHMCKNIMIYTPPCIYAQRDGRVRFGAHCTTTTYFLLKTLQSCTHYQRYQNKQKGAYTTTNTVCWLLCKLLFFLVVCWQLTYTYTHTCIHVGVVFPLFFTCTYMYMYMSTAESAAAHLPRRRHPITGAGWGHDRNV